MPVPKLRFKSENGMSYSEWEKQKLSDVSSRVTRKNKGNITDIPLTIASLYGLVDQREYFKKTIASQNMEGYYLLHNGEFAYNKSYSKGFDFGAIKRLDRYDCGALSTLYICFAINDILDSNFMTHYFDSQKWNKEVSIRCAEGARNHGLLNISTDDFFDIDIVLPIHLEEQKKIAEFLSNADEVILKSEAEVQNLEQQKKAILQKFYSQEVRFKDKDGTDYPDWRESTIGAEMSFVNGKAHENCEDDNGKYIIINSKYVSTNGDVKRRTNTLLEPLYVNDIVMVMSDVPNGKAMSKCLVIDRNDKYTLNQRICALRSNHNPIFIANQISRCKYFMAFDDGVKQTNLRKQDILNCPLQIASPEEQKKIADFLFAYDEAISFAKRELEKWKELKNGLLQQMFV